MPPLACIQDACPISQLWPLLRGMIVPKTRQPRQLLVGDREIDRAGRCAGIACCCRRHRSSRNVKGSVGRGPDPERASCRRGVAWQHSLDACAMFSRCRQVPRTVNHPLLSASARRQRIRAAHLSVWLLTTQDFLCQGPAGERQRSSRDLDCTLAARTPTRISDDHVGHNNIFSCSAER